MPGESVWLRWRLAVLIGVAILIVGIVLFMARSALFPFVIGIVVAQLLHPVVAFVEERMPGRTRWPGVVRGISILLIYALFVAGVAGIFFVTMPPIFAESREFIERFPEFYEQARSSVESWSHAFTERVPVELRMQLEQAVASGGSVLAGAAAGFVERTITGVSNAVSVVIGLAAIPFFLFYLLKDRDSVLSGVFAIMSPGARRQASDLIHIVNGVIAAYVRAQLLSAFIVGLLVFIGLTILGIPFAGILGLVAGLFGLIPIIGPILGAVPGILVALASSPSQVIWVVVVYTVVQLIENNVISPRIHGNAVRLHPAFVIAILIIGSEIAGLWGVVIGVPLTAAVRDVFVYFYKQWSGPEIQEPSVRVPTAPEDRSEPASEMGTGLELQEESQ